MPAAGPILGPSFTPVSLAKSRWHCRVQYVRKLISDGQLKAFALPNGRVRISYESVIEWEERHLVAAKPKRQWVPRRPADFIEYF